MPGAMPGQQSGSAVAGAATENPEAQDQALGALEQPPMGTDSRAGDRGEAQQTVDARQTAEQPWMTKLPPEIRAAIRSSAQQPAPRGYEERLQRYFENLD